MGDAGGGGDHPGLGEQAVRLHVRRGNTIAINPFNKHAFYTALGNYVYKSGDDGETWTQASTIPSPPGYTTDRCNAFVVSAKDSNYWVAAVEAPARIVWTDDAGASWHDAVDKTFGEYSIPLEVDPDQPDTMYFGARGDSLLRSIDRGKTWSKWGNTSFRVVFDIVVVPESDSSLILVTDAYVGVHPARYWRTTASSGVFADVDEMDSGKIHMACSRLRNSVIFGSNWSSGVLQRSEDSGLTWPVVSTVSQAYGIDIARDDPDCVVFGVYSGSAAYISLTGGATNSFSAIPNLPGSNYGMYARDRATILAQQSGGIWKLNVTQTMPLTAQGVAVTSPNGGEVWAPGSPHDITWNSTNVVLARIRFRRSPIDAWEEVAKVEGYRGHYAWLVPYEPTSSAQIAVSDAWDQTPADVSDGTFTIPTLVRVEGSAPAAFALRPNRPNPFAVRTEIGYALPEAARVSLEVFNLAGQRVAVLVAGEKGPGEYSVSFGPEAGRAWRDLPSGMYFYRFRAGSFTATHRMVMMR